MIAVVTGVIGTYPVGGVAWDYGQYALGLERLGFDVYYLEDSGLYTYDAEQNAYGEDPSYGVRFLEESLRTLSPAIGSRWHFRHFDGRTFGLDRKEILEVVAEADVLVNVSGLCQLREEYALSPRKVLIDTDPGWNHFYWYPLWDSESPPSGCRSYREHDVFFTYALGLGSPDCVLPQLGLEWHATRPPVVLDCWPLEPPGDRWTTIMTWDNYDGRAVEHDGVVYGSKEPEFERVEALPARVSPRLELAVGGVGAPKERWREAGWNVVDSISVSRTLADYRDYIVGSRGEFSVAKNIYVATGSGWFSCRSVCYLASGRPVVIQDTGFSSAIPVGEGLFAFASDDEAARAIETVEDEYDRHHAAARTVAEDVFASDVVLGDLLERAGVG
jgi:hypothetical protein